MPDGGFDRGGATARARSTDLRGSMALVLAALRAPGVSRIDRVDLALRGYDDLQAKLAGLGVPIEVADE